MRYKITSSNVVGEIFITFNNDGITELIEFNDFKPTLDQLKFISTHMPLHIQWLEPFLKLDNSFKIKEVPDVITFEATYKKWGLLMKKQAASRAWDRLTESEQKEAWMYIPRYNYKLALEPWRNRMLLSSYLNGKIWLDDK